MKSAILTQLEAADLVRFFRDVPLDGKGYALGIVNADALTSYLNDHAGFLADDWHHLHPEVGKPRISFRSVNGRFGKGSIQIVYNTQDGRCYADVDRFNTQDVVNIVAHLFGEVIFKKLFRRKGKAPHGSPDSRVATRQHDRGDCETGDRGSAA
jgi:hypothetical protein